MASQTSRVKKPEQGSATAASSTGVSKEDFYNVVEIVGESFSRDQQVKIGKLIAGMVSAQLIFPNAKESLLRKEIAKASTSNANKGAQPTVKPENRAMRGSPEEITLRKAQKALRDKRVELGLEKASVDNRLADLIAAVKLANDNFQMKKSAVKTELSALT